MKLLEKNNRTFFRFTARLLLFGGLLFYCSVNWIIHSEIDEKLQVNQARALELLRNGQPAPQFAPVVEVLVLTENTAPTEAAYSDTVIYDPIEKEDEPYRQLAAQLEINGHFYRVVNRTSLVETEDLTLAIALCTAALALLLFGGLYWLNHRSAQALWQPFQQNLDALKRFSLAQNKPLTLAASDVDEFEELKAVLQKLTDKLRSDYQSLKEFTENASHEMQTPLAVIRSKIEEFIEAEGLLEGNMAVLQGIYEAANRLSRLNQSLLLLAKIENRQFGEASEVSLDAIVAEQMEFLQELTEAKILHLDADLECETPMTTNRTLVEILVKNLLENAIRYSLPGDTIFIQTTPRQITFGNPGKQAIEHPERLFERFYKQGDHTASLGLGLAIVQKICEVNGWEVGYAFREGRHEFKVRF